MLKQTFVHIPGVGEVIERRLWERGIVTWSDALDTPEPPEVFSPARWDYARRLLERSAAALERRNHRHFTRDLKSKYHWRAWPEFRTRTAYLDIETTGLESSDEVTVVGLYDGERVRSFVAGENLNELPEALERYALLVTYNGACFDLPFLRRCVPGLELHQLHVDLMYPLRALGLRGGLKAVERRLGIARDSDIAHLDGWDAVRLWQEWRRGRRASLELLLRYNAADIENLEILMEHVYQEMRARANMPDCPGGET